MTNHTLIHIITIELFTLAGLILLVLAEHLHTQSEKKNYQRILKILATDRNQPTDDGYGPWSTYINMHKVK